MKYILILSMALISLGCSHQAKNSPNSKYSNITISKQGQSLDDDPVIASACSEFTLSKDSVDTFFSQANTISDFELHSEHDILPCYSTGTLTFNNQQYTWRIRAGGTGELSTAKETINKVCSQEDCSNIPNLH